MKSLLKITATTLMGTICAFASAEAVDTQARAWAASCAACHGTHGKGASSGIPSISGQTKEVLLQKLLAFKRDQLPATVMHQQAKGYTDAELARIAAHLAQVNR
jgi:cytochrome subunit of sulfide dehydrogenase